MRWFKVLLALLVLLSQWQTAAACQLAEPKLWVYSQQALLYGRAIDVRDDQWAATLEVIAYAGPGQAPATVELPKRTKFHSSCDDMAGRFEEGHEYLVVVKSQPQDLASIPAEIRTVLAPQNGQLNMDYIDDWTTIDTILATFSEQQALQPQQPAKRPTNPWPWLAGATLLLAAIVINQKRGRG